MQARSLPVDVRFLSTDNVTFDDSGESFLFLPELPDYEYNGSANGFDSPFSAEFYKVLGSLEEGVYTLTFYVQGECYNDDFVIDDVFEFDMHNGCLIRNIDAQSGYIPLTILYYAGRGSIEMLDSFCMSTRVAGFMYESICDTMRTFPVTLDYDKQILVSIKEIRDPLGKQMV
ncbi:hypothetical protein GCM10023220_70840 [Streptomyces ziwulingensis]|uniref:Uncharacterized protein n=1 Tax=Streptomyces ziwulingensis TaxID=1045501 RepID=A0ABP9D398_9ACTN